jgi:hemerythrin superfamily protein
MANIKQHRSSAAAGDSDAIAALTADHKKVKALFKAFDKLKSEANAESRKAELVAQICTELKIHAEIEEEVFYPAVRAQIDEEDLMDEALVEHAGAKQLIAQLEKMHPKDDLYDAKVTVLGEQIEHHVKEEEGEMFPKAKKAKIDNAELGARMAQLKLRLQATLGTSPATNADDEDDRVPPPAGSASRARRIRT